MHISDISFHKWSKTCRMDGSITVKHDDGSEHKIVISANDMPEVLRAIGQSLVRSAADNAKMLEDAARREVESLLIAGPILT